MLKFITLKNSLYILFILLILAPVTGELWKISVWRFDFAPADIIIPIIFVVWVADKLKNDRKLRLGKIGKMMVFFLFVLTTTYFINFYRFPVKEMAVAFSLLGRFGMYLVLAPIAYDLIERDRKDFFRRLILIMMMISMVIICVLGFLQLRFFPDFEELGLHLHGWDPHIGRLLSTWFDPNFIGGFLAFVLGPVIALALYFYHKKNTKWLCVIAAISFTGLFAIYLTYSRSGYLALIAVMAFLAFFKSRKLLVAGFLVMLLVFSFSPRVQQRTTEAWDSGKAFLGLNSQVPLDPTAELRVWSWRFAWEMIEENPWIGVGYGRYAYEINQRGHGLLSNHASGGSDSSLLTIWAVSGIFGILSYLAIGFVAASVSIRRLWKKNNIRSYVDSGLVAGFGGIMAHAFFVNSLLYSLMMIYLMTGLALLDER